MNIMREVEGSLQRLQTDYIDLYQVHGWDSNTPLEETLRTLDDLVRQGKVRYIGLSNFMSWQAATAVMLQERLGLEKYVTAQMYYSLVGRGLEYEFQSFAEYHNIGILVWSPLAGGFLAGKYSRANPAPAGSRFAEAGQFVPFDKEMGYRVVDALKEVAAPAWRKPGACGDRLGAGPAGRQQRDHRRPEGGATGGQHPRRRPSALGRGRPATGRGVGSGHSLSEVDGLSARHRGGPASEGPASRALREGGPWKDLRGTR